MCKTGEWIALTVEHREYQPSKNEAPSENWHWPDLSESEFIGVQRRPTDQR